MSSSRIKDASFIQLHLEKLILAFGVLVLLVGVFLFVIGNPFAVKLNNQAYDDPADAVNVLSLADSRLQRGLADTDPLPEIITPDFRENFIAMIEQRIDSEIPLTSLSDPGLTDLAINPIEPEPSRYALVYPPAPMNISHVYGPDVLDKEFDLEATKRYYELWGKDINEPGDFTMFIASGDFDIWQWVSRLREDPKSGDAIKIPTGIWAQRFGIAGVALLREEFDPEEGRWTDRKIVEAMPNQFRLLPDFEAPQETTEAMMEVARLREGQIELAQPDLPWLKGFVQAVAPGGEKDGDGIDGFLQGVDEENLGPKEKEILKLEEKIKKLEERRARQNQRNAPAGNARPGDFDAPRGPSERSDPIARQIEDIRKKIERLRPVAEREKVNRERLAEERRLREEERKRREALKSERDRGVFGPTDGAAGQDNIEGMSLQEGATLRVWAADPSMQPGKTYRYKLLVSAINPLYAVPRLAQDQLEENQQRAALLPTEAEIESMAWIGPIKVEPKSRFFFTNGRESSVSVDIYQRHDGELVYQDFDGSPGDTIGSVIEVEDEFGQIKEIDMSVGAVLVDVEQRRDALASSFVKSMIFMDAEGNIHERIESLDKSNPDRKKLRDEYENGAEKPLRPNKGELPGGDDFDPRFGPGDF